MEAGPGGLGEGLGRDRSFSLALMLTRREPAGGSHRSALCAGPAAPWLPSGLPAARCAQGLAALRLNKNKQRPGQCAQGGAGSSIHAGIPRSPPLWRCALRLETPGGEGAAGGAQTARNPGEARSRAAGQGLSARKSRGDFSFLKRKRQQPATSCSSDFHLSFHFLPFWFSDH